MAQLVQERVSLLSEAPGYVDFLMLAEPELDEAAVAKVLGAADANDILADTIAAYESAPWSAASLKASFEEVAARHGSKVGKAQAPVRVAITGRTVGPPLFESLELLGRDETLRRLRAGWEIAGGA